MKIKYFSPLFCVVFLFGCSSLLPSRQEILKTSRNMSSYDKILSTYSKIKVDETTKRDLASQKISEGAANVEAISGLDLMAKFSTNVLLKVENLPKGLQKCMKKTDNCIAYQLELSSINKKRYGSFLADYLGFRKKERTTGYDVNMLIVLVSDNDKYTVVYKQLTGKSNIYEEDEKKYPLGFFGDEIPSEITDIIMKSVESAVKYY